MNLIYSTGLKVVVIKEILTGVVVVGAKLGREKVSVWCDRIKNHKDKIDAGAQLSTMVAETTERKVREVRYLGDERDPGC